MIPGAVDGNMQMGQMGGGVFSLVLLARLAWSLAHLSHLNRKKLTIHIEKTSHVFYIHYLHRIHKYIRTSHH